MKKNIVFIFILYCLTASSAHGEIYFWTDEQGFRHYSNVEHPSSEESFEAFRENNAKFNSLASGIQKGLRFDVVKVYDGDSIKIKGSDLVLMVRLAGIDAPESGRKGVEGQPFSRKAREALVRMIADSRVSIKSYGTGSYNRMLSEVFNEKGINMNLELVRQGMAEVYRGKPPPGFDVGPYHRAQSDAKRRRRGIWSLGSTYKSPKQWRKEHPRK